MNIAIYQVNLDRDSTHRAFRSLGSFSRTEFPTIVAGSYDKVFDGDVSTADLEDVFCIFNVSLPDGYSGRSMSVSDVVEVKETGEESRFYYCDTFGFSEVKFF